MIQDARELINKSGDGESSEELAMTMESDRAVPRLTAGGALMLSRTLTKLEVLWEARTSSKLPGGNA